MTTYFIHLRLAFTIVTICATLYRNSNPYFPSSHIHFQDPCFVSITFLFPILTLTLWSVLGTLYAWPCLSSPFHTCSLSTLTEDSVITSWNYSSPLLRSQPALLPVVIKASHQCIVESVQISTKFRLSINSSFSLSPSASLWSGILQTSVLPTAVLTVPLWNTGPDDFKLRST